MKNLQFSDTSRLYVYYEDQQYAEAKAYSTEDKKRFSLDALREAVRIKKQVIKSGKASRQLPLAAQVEACGISKEEIVGVEHLILENPRRIYERRRTHTQAVLRSYAEQRDEDDAVHRLAKLSITLTKIPAAQAQKRAARAA